MENYEEYVGAVAQIEHEHEEKKYTKKVIDMISEAASKKAKVVVFPECASPAGNIFHDEEEARKMTEPIPGPFTNILSNLCKEHGIFLCFGIAEPRGGKFYNSTAIFDPTGKMIGIYRKNFLINFDSRCFSLLEPDDCGPGEDNYPVWDTAIGRIGSLICGDAWVPENARSLALQGCEVVLYSALWGIFPQWVYNTPARAIENRMWFLAADKVGVERGMVYPGQSFIMDPEGNVLAKAGEEEKVIYATIRPSLARNKKLKDGTDLFASRRPDKYGLVTKPLSECPVLQLLDTPIVPDTTSTPVACVEIEADLTSKEELIEKAFTAAKDAALLYSSVILLPEIWIDGPSFDPKYWAEPIPGPMSGKFSELAKEECIYIAYGAIESQGNDLYKTTVLIGMKGEILGKYRAMQLSEQDAAWAKPGYDYVVGDTEFGRIGLIAGMDGWYFEVTRSLALLGADAILWPRDYNSPLERDILAPERAVENKVFMFVAAKRGKDAIGGSLIVDNSGNVIAKGKFSNQILRYQAQFVRSRCKMHWPKTDFIKDRRPHIYWRVVEAVKPF